MKQVGPKIRHSDSVVMKAENNNSVDGLAEARSEVDKFLWMGTTRILLPLTLGYALSQVFGLKEKIQAYMPSSSGNEKIVQVDNTHKINTKMDSHVDQYFQHQAKKRRAASLAPQKEIQENIVGSWSKFAQMRQEYSGKYPEAFANFNANFTNCASTSAVSSHRVQSYGGRLSGIQSYGVYPNGNDVLSPRDLNSLSCFSHTLDMRVTNVKNSIAIAKAYKIANQQVEAAQNCEADGTCDELLQGVLENLGLNVDIKNPMQKPVQKLQP